MSTAVSTWLALILIAAAASKAWRRDESAAALATYGITTPILQRLLMSGLLGVELGLAVALLARLPGSAAAAAGLFLTFALATSAALLAGRRGLPCACLGGSSRLGRGSPVLAGALTLLAAGLAFGWLGAAPAGYARWLTLALSVTVAAVAALAVAVLALAREVGLLRLQASSHGALEIAEEGPVLGVSQPWAAAVPRGPRALLLLAIFTSEACPLCRRVTPAVQHIASDPLLAVRSFDEVAAAGTWEAAEVPGSPYAVALDLDGVALAKGTFNSLGELESIVATARARERGLSVAA